MQNTVIGIGGILKNQMLQHNRKNSKILTDNEMDFLLNTSIAWEIIRPQLSDKESLEKLISEVHMAIKNDENIAQLKSRLENLGGKVMSAAKKVYFIAGE